MKGGSILARWGRLAVFTVLVAGLVPGVSRAAAACSLLSDPAGDVSRPVDDTSPPSQNVDAGVAPKIPAPPSTARPRHVDRSTDLRAVRASYQNNTLSFEASVSDLERTIPDDTDHQVWVFDWTIGGTHYEASVFRDRSGVATFWSGDTVPDATPTGTLDTRENTVSVDAFNELPVGQRITDISGHARDEAPGQVVMQADDAPQKATDSATYFAGVACEDQTAQVCPVILDAKGDAGPFRTYDGRTVPADQRSLDIVSAGATTSDQTIALTMRILDLKAQDPAGYDTVGWTVSWRSTNGRRVIAQARRSGAVAKFTYALDPKPDTGPSGPVFGGTATDGSLDLDSGLVTIVVPRSIAGDALPRFGATSWVMRTTVSVQPFLVVDQTPLGRYRTGIACSA